MNAPTTTTSEIILTCDPAGTKPSDQYHYTDPSLLDNLVFEFCYKPWQATKATINSPWFWLALLVGSVVGWFVIRRWRLGRSAKMKH